MDEKLAVVAMTAIIGGIVVAVTLIRAIAGRWRTPALRNADDTSLRVEARLETLQSSIDAMALEIERISEGQRFTTKLLSERGEALPRGRPPSPMDA